jgi:hypothetical protein
MVRSRANITPQSIFTAVTGWLMAPTLALLLAAGGTQHAAAQSVRDRLIDAPAPQFGNRRDILELRSGTRHEGSLQGCSAQACALGQRSFPRPEVSVIGLAVSAGDTPAPVADPSQDTVQLRNGTVVKGKLLGINSQAVVSEQGSYQRAEVAWVILAAPQRADGGSPGDRARAPGDRARACDRREVFLYDVAVNGRKRGTETFRDVDGKDYSFSFDYAYSAHYPRVPVTIEHNCSGDIKIDGPTDPDPHPGSASLDRYHWSNSITRTIRHETGGGRPFSIDGPPGYFENRIVTCSFDVAIGGLRAQIELKGYVPGSPGGRATINVSSRLRSGEDRHEALIGARHEAECDKGTPSHARVFDSLPYASGQGEGIVQFYSKPTEVAGAELDPPFLNLPGGIGTRDGDSAEARKLARGESFSVSSGRRTWQTTDEGTNMQGRATAATSVTVTFSRAP